MPTTLRRMHNGVYTWWERDADLDLSHVGPLPDYGHEDCWHRNYLLTCKQYEYLLRRSGWNCEMCGLPGPQAFRGRLQIDHDPARGRWAVRGLLCRWCNSVERFPFVGRRAEQYRANAWYIGVLAEAGINRDPRQPRIGSVVLDHADRPWHRTDEGWWPKGNRPRVYEPHTWKSLIFRYGPHNLHVIGATTW